MATKKKGKKKAKRGGRKKMSAMDFIVSRLKKNPKAAYAEIKAEADKKRLTIYPINYGRAQLMLGITKKGKGKATKAKKVAGRRGPGRPRKSAGSSKSDRIRELLGSGMASSEIAKKVGCTVNLVYAVKSKGGVTKKQSGRGPGRPRKNAAAMDLSGLVSTIQNLQAERDEAVAMLEKVRALLG